MGNEPVLGMAVGFLLVMSIVYLLFALVPAFIAYQRGHPHTAAIFILCLLFGWTLLGWVAAFIWSFVVEVKPARSRPRGRGGSRGSKSRRNESESRGRYGRPRPRRSEDSDAELERLRLKSEILDKEAELERLRQRSEKSEFDNTALEDDEDIRRFAANPTKRTSPDSRRRRRKR